MASKDVDYGRNILNPGGVELPDVTPPTNHGHTPAAWFLTIFGIVGSVLIGLGMPLNSNALIVVGIVVVVIGAVGGVALSLAGKGQARALKR